MAVKKGGLGKGIDALIYDNTVESTAGEAVKLSINEIEPNREQPRKSFEPQALSELSESIKEHGILQPLLVRPMADGNKRNKSTAQASRAISLNHRLERMAKGR